MLSEATTEMDFHIGWIFAIAQLFVMLSRVVLFLLMRVGQLVSGILLRQMEYDADLHEAWLVGNEVFRHTSNKLQLLGVSTEAAHQAAFQFFQQGDLADDFSRFTLHFAASMPAEVKAKIAKVEPKASLFSTHPSDTDRIASVRRFDHPGVFHVDGRARDLFRHFDATSRNVTWDFYCQLLGNIKKQAMRPVAELLSGSPRERARAKVEAQRKELPPLKLD